MNTYRLEYKPRHDKIFLMEGGECVVSFLARSLNVDIAAGAAIAHRLEPFINDAFESCERVGHHKTRKQLWYMFGVRPEQDFWQDKKDRQDEVRRRRS